MAAPTTSLPEQLGGVRNWDYRFCWLRDATLTLLALMNAGFYDEAHAWRDWLLRAVAGSPEQVQIMYGLAGERRLTEWEVPWLPGYENSAPVRIGNAAHGQLQLDVFGEVMDALHQARRGTGSPRDESGWDMQRAFLDHLEQIWPEPDEGIWEVRGGNRQFTYSKVMAWVAFDRGDQERGGVRARRPARPLASRRRRNPRGRLPARIRCASWEASFKPTEASSSTPASCYCRRSDSCLPTMRACAARCGRSRSGFWSTDSSCATTPNTRRTACRRGRARSLPAASGWSTPTSCRTAGRMRERCSTGC